MWPVWGVDEIFKILSLSQWPAERVARAERHFVRAGTETRVLQQLGGVRAPDASLPRPASRVPRPSSLSIAPAALKRT